MTVGRPRSFCTIQALEKATQLFWRQGYEGTSISDLTKAIGINSPSLYAAFGGKKELFHQVVVHHDAQNKSFMEKVLAAPCARDVVTSLLRGVAIRVTDTSAGYPPGSLLVQCGLSCSDATIPAELTRRRAHWETVLRERLIRAQAEGDLPAAADPSALARHLMVVSIGMCIAAAEGASRDELLGLAEMAALPIQKACEPRSEAK